MKFALYQPWLYLHGGLERSILELVTRSRHDWTIYTGYYDPLGTFPEFQSMNVQVVGHTSVKRNFTGVLKSMFNLLQLKLPLDQATDGLVVWCDGIGDMVVFKNGGRPIFNICSTPLRAAFDPVYEEAVTSKMGPFYKVLYQCFRLAFRFIDRLAWKKFYGVVTTSKEVRDRIYAGKLADETRQSVMAYPGINWSPEMPVSHYAPVILVAGRIMWTKNIEQAIRAFLLAAPPVEWKLVIAGYVDEKSQDYLEELRQLAKADSRIEFVTKPTDERLLELYQRASFCLFTPLNEDWGIVPLEAMAQGKPVVANARGGPLESVAHGKTGLLVEPNDSEWAAAISLLTSDPELVKRLGKQAHAHVQKYTWQEFTSTVDDALERWTLNSVKREPAPSQLSV